MEVLIEKGAIDKQFEIDKKYQGYKDILENSKYLADINEDLIYNIYREVIQLDNSREFPKEFDQSHRDAFLRLKLRGVSYSQAMRVAP